MTTALIIGSGASAAGAALALSQRADLEITVIDVGSQLEPEREQLVSELAAERPAEWNKGTVDRVSQLPVASNGRGVPEKRVFGSNYPFKDAGQLAGISGLSGANAAVVTSAYGGFSNVWGAQFMPFTPDTFNNWPVKSAAMRPHYEAILDRIPFSGEEDDLAARFPLLRAAAPLPPMSPRSARILGAYEKHRARINNRGITLGKARLALEAKECVRCGLCMTGCPYGLIYSAAQTFNELRRAGKVKFLSGLLALKIEEQADHVTVVAKEVSTGQLQRFVADRVYVAGGAMGSTRLAANSLGLFDTDIAMQESRQYILPFLSRRAVEDPRGKDDFTLNQFNMLVSPDGGDVDVSLLHFYSFNTAFLDGLPSVLQASWAEPLTAQLLRRLSVAFGYLPSWNSPRLRVRVGAQPGDLELPAFQVSGEAAPSGQNKMLSAVLRRLARSAPQLDLYPAVPMLRLSTAGKSYHWGGSFPHRDDHSTAFSSDTLGRVGSWKRTHLVDASVWPTIPSTTYGLTAMANSHRIATESMELVS
jgi:ferredoxin